MADIHRYRVIRPLSPVAGGPVLEAAPEDAPALRVVVWPGAPPTTQLPDHPALGQVEVVGRTAGATVWVERRPPGVLLSDLPRPLPAAVCAWVAVGVAEGLAALHGAGLAHGGLVPERIVVSPDARVVLIGPCVSAGNPVSDLQVLRDLYGDLDRLADPLLSADAAAMADELRARMGGQPGPPSDLAGRVDRAALPVPEDARRVEITRLPAGEPWAIDEVGFDLGPDEAGRGLLDQWSRSGGTTTGETTGPEHTGALGLDDGPGPAATAALARLAGGLYGDARSERFERAEGLPSRTVKALIADEPLDPVPMPDGLPLSASSAEAPATSDEVTADAHADVAADRTNTQVRLADVTAVAERPTAATDHTSPRTDSLDGPDIPLFVLVVAVLLALFAGAGALWLFTAVL